MEQQLIAVVDGSRARYFSVDSRTTPQGEKKPTLVEVDTLINPANRMNDGELYSESRPGLRSASGGGPAHGVDDRRDAHNDENNRKFAKLVLQKMAEIIREKDIKSAILAAGPKMLGHMRDNKNLLPYIDIGELPKHLTELSPHELLQRLEASDLL